MTPNNAKLTPQDTTLLFTPMSKVAVPDGVIEQIKGLMDVGQLSPGAQLPPERELAQRLGVARTSVREALRVLRALGLIDIRRGQGTFVAVSPPAPHTDYERLQTTPEGYSLEEVMDVRLVLEFRAAELACQKIAEPARAQLQELVDGLRAAAQAGDVVELTVHDTAFHQTIFAAAGNRALTNMYDQLLEYSVSTREAGWRSAGPEQARALVSLHEELSGAIQRGDVAAALDATWRMVVGVADHAGVSDFAASHEAVLGFRRPGQR